VTLPRRPTVFPLAQYVEHHPSDDCWDDHCYSHHVDEPANDPSYLVCGECRHRYRTKRELRSVERASLLRDWRFPSYRPRVLALGPYEQSIWRWTWRYLTVRAGKIYSCPYCIADF
jgi:hypothetical protein